MIVSLIVAVAENGVIGKDNKLIWKMPADMKFFKTKTSGHHMIMGRKTFESTGVLPNRTTIVISRNKDLVLPQGCILASSVQDALSKVKNDDEAFIIGGEEIFRLSLDIADRIYFTRIHHSFEGDAFFPEIDETKWELIGRDDRLPDDRNAYSFSFLEYRKR